MHALVAGLIWIGFGAVILVFGLLFVLEGILYLTHQDPITVYVRNWSWGHLWVAAFVAVGLGAGSSAALTHFLLDGQREGRSHAWPSASQLFRAPGRGLSRASLPSRCCRRG